MRGQSKPTETQPENPACSSSMDQGRAKNLSKPRRVRRTNTAEASILCEKTQKFPNKTTQAFSKFRTAFDAYSVSRNANSHCIEKELPGLRSAQLRSVRNSESTSKLSELQQSLLHLKHTFFKQQEDRVMIKKESELIKRELKEISIRMNARDKNCCDIF